MSSLSLVLGAAAPTATGFVLLLVGEVIRRRTVQPENRLALDCFAAWWYGMGASILCYTGQSYLAAAGADDVALYRVLLMTLALCLSVALAGLVFYLQYLYTGRRGPFIPVVAFYATYYAFNLYRFTAFPPYELRVDAWSATVIGQEGPAWVFLVFALATTLPVLVAAAAYGSLFFRSRDPANRYRIAMVSGAFGLWFGSFLAAFLLTDATLGAAPVLLQSMGLVAALLILTAYHPPASIRRRLGLGEHHPGA